MLMRSISVYGEKFIQSRSIRLFSTKTYNFVGSCLDVEFEVILNGKANVENNLEKVVRLLDVLIYN